MPIRQNILYDYIDREIEKAIENPGKDLYSVLLASDVDGKKLTKEEVKGVMVLTFAGGRDTIINAVTNAIAYLSENPESLERFRKEPEIIGKAVEEMIRYFFTLDPDGARCNRRYTSMRACGKGRYQSFALLGFGQ